MKVINTNMKIINTNMKIITTSMKILNTIKLSGILVTIISIFKLTRIFLELT